MRWRLLKQILVFEPGIRAVAIASTDFPDELFADHFPGVPVTPGVLLIEMAAQLAGRLIGVTASQRAGMLRLPFLSMVLEAKLRRFVGPNETIQIETQLEELETLSALCSARLICNGERIANMRLMFAFLPDDEAARQDRSPLEAYERAEFLRLGLDGFPPGPVHVAAH